MNIPENYIEKVYSGWLGKIIGVRHGANVEGWTYDRLQRTFGEINTYLYEFKNFAADDDTNGPVFFMRALEDYDRTDDITPLEMGLTLLNYVPDGHGFFWWGGYGKSTEHTAYANLKGGIMAPRSGSIEQNGVSVAEQIGGQIFIDVWGFLNPGQPHKAADYARKMASVTHDGNGLYGGMFIAACIAQAFVTNDIEKIIQAGLSVIPIDCQYSHMVRDVTEFYNFHLKDWRQCFEYVREHFGYHLYPGNCHIIPNSAVIVLSLLYGRGDFSRAINICNMCGWDTDCNVGNVGAIVGTMNGIDGIARSWIEPINDFLCCSSTIGSLNIWDIPTLASYTAKLGYKIAGERPPKTWYGILNAKDRYFHFEYPGSTHAFCTDSDEGIYCKVILSNTSEAAHSGNRALKIVIPKAHAGNAVRIYYKTYYMPDDFDDSRYDPDFSPLLYPGQRIETYIKVPKDVDGIMASLYVKDRNSGKRYYGPKIMVEADQWVRLSYDIPGMSDVVLSESGIEFMPGQRFISRGEFPITIYLDDFRFMGEPCYSIDFSKERMEKWGGLHEMVSQLTYLRGLWTLEDGQLSGSYCGGVAESYTGDVKWEDYRFEAEVIPKLGEFHNVNFRVQGAMRSYAVGLAPNNTIALYKKSGEYNVLAQSEFDWINGHTYIIEVEVAGDEYTVSVDGRKLIEYKDEDNPYMHGQIGFSNFGGSHTHYAGFSVEGM